MLSGCENENLYVDAVLEFSSQNLARSDFFFYFFSLEGLLRDFSTTFQERILKIGKGVVFDQKPTSMKYILCQEKK